MELDEVISRRRMTRRFEDRPIPQSLLDRVLAAGTRAPSAGGSQGTELLVLAGARRRSLFWELSTESHWRQDVNRSSGLLAAPVVVLPVCDPHAYVERYARDDKSSTLLAGLPAAQWPVPYWLVDSAFSVMNMLLAATDRGIGALFFQLHAPAAVVLKGLGVPEGRELIGALALGYDASERASRTPGRGRPAGEEIVHRDHW